MRDLGLDMWDLLVHMCGLSGAHVWLSGICTQLD